jgi:hypothetical protein
MRLFLVSLLALFAAACGSVQSGEGPAGGSAPAATIKRPTEVALSTRPPSPVLVSAAGKQIGVLGSYCVTSQVQGGCGDSGPIHPDKVSIVHPGDTLTFVLGSAIVARPEGCQAADEQGCIGTVTVRPLGCDRKAVSTIPLSEGRGTAWAVGLDAGAYQLDLFAYFKADDGRTGDLSGSFGLLVQPSGDLKIQPVDPQQASCPFSG